MPPERHTHAPRSGGHLLEQALDRRLPRPQKVLNRSHGVVPTKLALLEVKARQEAESDRSSLRTQSQSAASSSANQQFRSPVKPSYIVSRKDQSQLVETTQLGPLVTLGTLTQDAVDWDVRAQRGRRGLIMVKRLIPAIHAMQKQALDVVKHENIIRVLDVVSNSEWTELSFEYARFTLAQILYVHLKLDELHIQCIAYAVSYLL